MPRSSARMKTTFGFEGGAANDAPPAMRTAATAVKIRVLMGAGGVVGQIANPAYGFVALGQLKVADNFAPVAGQQLEDEVEANRRLEEPDRSVGHQDHRSARVERVDLLFVDAVHGDRA